MGVEGVSTKLEVTFEVIDEVIRGISNNLGIHADYLFTGVYSLGDRDGLSELPVSFSIELISSDEDCPTLFCSVQ